MLSINTNLSSLIVQNSMKQSTNRLNTAIERMTTGYKLNHSKDNAANYSIATNMDTKIGALQVAEDNVLQGLDMVSTASGNLSQLQDLLTRVRDLAVQSLNNTYNDKSLSVIGSEVGAIVDEMNRIYSTAEYNGQKVFKNMAPPEIPDGIGTSGNVGVQPIATYSLRATDYGDFIDNPYTYTDEEVANMKTITQAISESSLVSGGEYSISTVDELVALADYVNAGNDTTGMTFVLGADIDLSSISNWTPIGDYATDTTYQFKGTFDGNGHTISNLTINRSANYQGLFGRTTSGSVIQNVSIESGSIKGIAYLGGLVGYSASAIANCYANGSLKGTGDYCGGLVGVSISTITTCYTTGSIDGGAWNIGGLVGHGSCSNSYSTSNVYGGAYVGGLVGKGSCSNSYSTGRVEGGGQVGGLLGASNSTVSNCYATGPVYGNSSVGGLIGQMPNGHDVSNCYATGSVYGNSSVGGLVGDAFGALIANSHASGTINGKNAVGGLVGKIDNHTTINNSYATSNVIGTKVVGGLVGEAGGVIKNSNALGSVTGTTNVGGLVGYATNTITNSYATGSVSGDDFVGGLIGQLYKPTGTTNITECLSYSSVTGIDSDSTGGLIGGTVLTTNNTTFGTVNITNSQAMSQDMNSIGGSYMYASSTYTLLDTYDMSAMTAGVSLYVPEVTSLTLQVGANASDSNQITFDMAFMLDNVNDLRQIGLNTTEDSLKLVDNLLNLVNNKQTLYGAVENRLMSVLDEISTQYENLVSSRSTIRDADIAEVSSQYIQQQILQQASATLLSTANQSPSIALQLI